MLELDTALQKAWNVCGARRAAKLLPRLQQVNCVEGSLLFFDVWDTSIRAHPRATFALLASKADATQLSYSRTLAAFQLKDDVGANLSQAMYYDAWSRMLERLDNHPNHFSFTMNGDWHGFNTQNLARGPEGGFGDGDRPKVFEWLTQLASRRRGHRKIRLKNVCRGPLVLLRPLGQNGTRLLEVGGGTNDSLADSLQADDNDTLANYCDAALSGVKKRLRS